MPIQGQQRHNPLLTNPLKEAGHPFVENYGPDTYDAFYQNWGATQDSLGIVYFANGDGVLSYDGVHWNLVELPNKGTVFSLDTAKDGTIYVGAHNELGYLKAKENGEMQFISLLPFLEKEYHDFNIIRQTYATNHGVYFGAGQVLFKWDGEAFTVWDFPEGTRISTHEVNGEIYQHNSNLGLTKLTNGNFSLIPQGEKFIDLRLRFMSSLGKNGILLGCSSSLYKLNENGIEELLIDMPKFLEENVLYRGAVLHNGTVALGSLNKGILIIDKQGRQRTLISGEELLLSDQILGLFQDRAGLLWAGLQTGIAKIEYPSAFSVYDKSNQLSEHIYDITRFNDSIYIGTATGLQVLKFDRQTGRTLAYPVSGISGSTFDLMVFRDQLMIGAYGLYSKTAKGPPRQILEESIHYLQKSVIDSNRVFVALAPGLKAVRFEKGEWIEERTFDEVKYSVHTVVEDGEGNLWLRTNDNTIGLVSFTNKQAARSLKQPVHRIYDAEDGFPNDVGIPYLIDGILYFITSAGAPYYYNATKDRFEENTTFYERLGVLAERAKVSHVDKAGNIWIIVYEDGEKKDQLVALKKENGGYQLRAMHEDRIIDLRREVVFSELKDSLLWYRANSVGLIRHDLNGKSGNSDLRPSTFIKEVWYQTDSLLYAGHGKGNNYEIPYQQNQLRFKFSSPFFYRESQNKFQYLLEGYDLQWSEWTGETQKDYTNIPEGNYTFKVRSKNTFGLVGGEDHYRFAILPPWYRSWWAYLLYVVMGALLLWLFGQWRSKQLRQKNLALETLVGERTEEIRKKNKLLQHQTERLKEMDTMKTRLFANISHEFRTPLTLIKGPVEKLETAKENKISTTNIKMIRRNANRLLNLVNQLLDLSKLDSGKLALNMAEGDVFKCVRAAASSFSSHAASRNMDYQIKIPSRLLWASFDRDKLEKVIYNLVGNALKFTKDEGKVIIEAQFRSSRLRLKVADTGEGISSDKLPYIFDRFFQVDDSYTKEKTGSGIGLALTKELVELMGGTIYVESELGNGTIFRVVLPLEEIKSNAKDDIVETTTPFWNDDEQQPSAILQEEKETRVLIIEDNNDMRHFIKEQLAEHYAIFEGRNGKEGLEMAKKESPALIITDLMMPQMDGITLCKKLKTDLSTCHIPVIMLTAKAGIER